MMSGVYFEVGIRIFNEPGSAMKSLASLLSAIILVTVVAGCGQSREKASTAEDRALSAPAASSAPSSPPSGSPSPSFNESAPSADASSFGSATSAPATYISSSAAVVSAQDSVRKFIRTAELKFKVESVIKATYAIEDITTRANGFVTYTNLNSVIDSRTVTPISADSSLETTYYTVSNQMVLRVPNRALDSTLKAIAAHIGYLDYRIIKADDVRLQTLANELARKRLARHQSRVAGAIDSRGKTLDETTDAEESLLERQEQSDAALLSNLTLEDQIEYSTINLSIYQRQAVARELFANDKNIDAYQPGLGTRLLEALELGWRALQSVIVFLTAYWALILFVIVASIVLRRYRRILMRKDRPE
jgi:hypothetical protein